MTSEVDRLFRLIEHLRAYAVQAAHRDGRDEDAAWLRLLTFDDIGSEASAPEAQRGRPVASPPALIEHSAPQTEAAWTPGRCLEWLVEHQALVRVLTAQNGERQVLVSVRPASRPEEVLLIRLPCSVESPVVDIGVAVQEAAASLSAHENRRRLRLVAGAEEGR